MANQLGVVPPSLKDEREETTPLAREAPTDDRQRPTNT